jgi:hypothetical protein
MLGPDAADPTTRTCVNDGRDDGRCTDDTRDNAVDELTVTLDGFATLALRPT